MSSGALAVPQRIGIYGTGGIGKTTLVSLARHAGKRVLVLDVDGGSWHVDCERLLLTSFAEVRAALADEALLAPYQCVAIDSISRVEELCVNHVIETIPVGSVEKRMGRADRLEDYGWGKGFQHVFEEMRKILGDLDRQIRQGRSVVCIAHVCKANVPNPAGDDFIRYEPRLQSSNTGKADFRSVFKEWLDHLLFVDYDIAVDASGKALGGGSRTIYPQERPTHLAKSRTLRDPIVYPEGSYELWVKLFQG